VNLGRAALFEYVGLGYNVIFRAGSEDLQASVTARGRPGAVRLNRVRQLLKSVHEVGLSNVRRQEAVATCLGTHPDRIVAARSRPCAPRVVRSLADHLEQPLGSAHVGHGGGRRILAPVAVSIFPASELRT
jgi:hypothetical protein